MLFIRSFSLEEMCLNVIVNNLELIVINTRIPQKSTDFLLRRYTAKVFDEYNKIEKDIKEDVMLWFLNPFAKEITLPRESCSKKIIKRFQFVGMGITSLNVSGSAAPEYKLNTIIRSVPCVKNLNLSLTSCTDKTMSVIHEVCPYLENLDLSGCRKVTDVGMKNLCGGNLSLKFLNLKNTCVYHEGLCTILRRMPSLEMCIKNDDICVGELILMDDMPETYNLIEFIFDKISVNHVEFIEMLTKRCPKIKILCFEFPVGKEVLEACTGFQDLEMLKFKHDDFFDDINDFFFLTPFLPTYLNLKILFFSNINIPTLLLFQSLKNLEQLYLKHVCFTSFKEEDITSTENKLNTLSIIDTNLSRPIIHKVINLLISFSKNVSNLILKYDNVPDDLYVVILNSMNNLSSVNLKHTRVEMQYLIKFFDIPSLKMLYVRKNSLRANFVAERKILPISSSTLSWCHSQDEDSDDDIFTYSEEEDHYPTSCADLDFGGNSSD